MQHIFVAYMGHRKRKQINCLPCLILLYCISYGFVL